MNNTNTVKTSPVYIRLPLEKATNCRDLGGYATDDLKVTRWGKLLRSSKLSDLSKDDKNFLYDYGIRSILDLRTNEEIEDSPNNFDERFENYHSNLQGGTLGQGIHEMISKLLDDEFVLGKFYVQMLEKHSLIKDTLDIIYKALDKGGIIYHCSAGKDRTGIISMLLLGISGVSKEDIIANYQISFTHIYKEFEENIEKYSMNLMESHPRNISKAYDYIMEDYGGFDNYFRVIGFSNEEIISFIDKIVE